MIFVAGDFALSKILFVFFILDLLVLEFIREETCQLLLGGPHDNFPPYLNLFIYLLRNWIHLFDSLFRSYFSVSQTDYY